MYACARAISSSIAPNLLRAYRWLNASRTLARCVMPAAAKEATEAAEEAGAEAVPGAAAGAAAAAAVLGAGEPAQVFGAVGRHDVPADGAQRPAIWVGLAARSGAGPEASLASPPPAGQK